MTRGFSTITLEQLVRLIWNGYRRKEKDRSFHSSTHLPVLETELADYRKVFTSCPASPCNGYDLATSAGFELEIFWHDRIVYSACGPYNCFLQCFVSLFGKNMGKTIFVLLKAQVAGIESPAHFVENICNRQTSQTDSQDNYWFSFNVKRMRF